MRFPSQFSYRSGKVVRQTHPKVGILVFTMRLVLADERPARE